ncbi:MAG: hypothetical protein AABY22_12900 [Nanoarchaeota archaeon]|mgnify:CR=1 FL=1
MLGYTDKTKKELKKRIGQHFVPVETSIFGAEYTGKDGKYPVVGPDAFTNRKWYALVEVKNLVIAKVT